MKKVTTLTVSLMFLLGGCSLSVDEQVESVKKCKEANLDYKIIENGYSVVVTVNCLKPEIDSDAKPAT